MNFDDFDDDLLKTVFKSKLFCYFFHSVDTPLIALQTADYYQRMAQKPLIVADTDSDTRERPMPVEINQALPDYEVYEIYRFLICRESGGDNYDVYLINNCQI